MRKYLVLCLAIVSFIAAVILISCGKVVPEPTPSPSSSTSTSSSSTTSTTGGGGGGTNYYPHADGYGWTYNRAMSTTSEVETLYSTIEGTTMVGTLSVQVLKSTSVVSSGSSTYETLYRVANDAVYFYGNPSTASPEVYIRMLTFPIQVGNTWEDRPGGTLIYSSEVVALENVTTPLSTFTNCYKVVTTYSTIVLNTLEAWYAPDVGAVKQSSLSPPYWSTTEVTGKNF